MIVVLTHPASPVSCCICFLFSLSSTKYTLVPPSSFYETQPNNTCLYADPTSVIPNASTTSCSFTIIVLSSLPPLLLSLSRTTHVRASLAIAIVIIIFHHRVFLGFSMTPLFPIYSSVPSPLLASPSSVPANWPFWDSLGAVSSCPHHRSSEVLSMHCDRRT